MLFNAFQTPSTGSYFFVFILGAGIGGRLTAIRVMPESICPMTKLRHLTTLKNAPHIQPCAR